jgi:hypothetical protein
MRPILTVLVLALLACRPAGEPAAPADARLPETPKADIPPVAPTVDHAARFAQLLAGRFDSSAQAAADPAEFKAVQLRACPVEAPELGARVLYVEQAMVEKPGAPYRQRVYVIEAGPGEGAVRSRVFTLREPKARVGLCDVPAAAPPRVAASEVEERQGCAVELNYTGEVYRGSTVGKGCASELAGATHATSEVLVTAKTIESWDRGYNAAGAQVWGATKGPYRFDRKSPLAD